MPSLLLYRAYNELLISGDSIVISEGIALTNGYLKINYSNFDA